MLHTATLSSISNCYNWINGVMNEEYLDNKLNKVRKRYGDELWEYLRGLLEINVNKRMDWL